jgi:hypothetical protein
MRGIYTCIPETNHVPKEYNVAAILSLIFMVPISLDYYYYYYYYYLTVIWLTPSGSSTVHIYTQTVHRIQRTEHT